MKNLVKSLILASITLVGTNALAKGPAKKQEPNCEINGKKKHVKDQPTCEKDKGKWLVVAPVVGSGSASGSGSPVSAAPAPVSGSGSTAEPQK